MIRFICALNFLFAFGIASAQDPAQTFQLGERALEVKNYPLARLAYERLLFFDQDSFAIASMKQLGVISQAEGKLKEASTWFERAASVTVAPDERAWCNLQRASLYLRMHDPKMGLMILYGLPEDLLDSQYRYQAFLSGIAYFMELNFQASQTSFNQALEPDDFRGRFLIDSLFTALKKIRHPKPKLAKILSILLPGTGQFYAGDFKNGLNSLLLTSGFLALGIYSLLFFTPFDAIVTVAPWFQRYYMGGYKRAALIAADKLNRKQNKIFIRILACFPQH
jgi:tetratricopeptide (TPR) repeat protein